MMAERGSYGILVSTFFIIYCANICLAQSSSTTDVITASTSVTSTASTSSTEHASSTPAGITSTQNPACGQCDIGASCSVSCGELMLPAVPQEDLFLTSVIQTTDPYTYLEITINALVLAPGERLYLTDSNATNFQRSTPQTIVSCNSNLVNDVFAFHAWSGFATVEYNYRKDDDSETCPTSSAELPRVVEFHASDIPPDGGDEPPDGELKFPGDNATVSEEGGEWAWAIPVAEGGGGYGVNTTINYASLDASFGDYLVINPGQQYDSAKSVLISWYTTSESARNLRFLGRDSFHVLLHIGPRNTGVSMDGVGFALTYSSFDAVTPVPTSTASTTPLPTPPSGKTESITVHVGNITPTDFVLSVEEFQTSIAESANSYCQKVNISLVKPITSSNVLVYAAGVCPPTWPDANLCVTVTFAVPVYTDPPSTYELTKPHLQQMWGIAGTQLPPPMMVYAEPEDLFWWWVGLTVCVLLVAILIIITAWRIDVHNSINSYRKQQSLIGQGSNGRDSNSWGGTMSHQVVPPYLVMEPSEQTSTGNQELYATHDWGYNERFSYSASESGAGTINQAYHDDDEDVDIFSRQTRERIAEEDSDSGTDIVQAVVPDGIQPSGRVTRTAPQVPIYENPTVTNDSHLFIRKSHLDEHTSETMF